MFWIFKSITDKPAFFEIWEPISFISVLKSFTQVKFDQNLHVLVVDHYT